MSDISKVGQIKARMVRLEGDPAVMRDTITENNYHLESSLEAAALIEMINNYHTLTITLNKEITALSDMVDVMEELRNAEKEEEPNG